MIPTLATQTEYANLSQNALLTLTALTTARFGSIVTQTLGQLINVYQRAVLKAAQTAEPAIMEAAGSAYQTASQQTRITAGKAMFVSEITRVLRSNAAVTVPANI